MARRSTPRFNRTVPKLNRAVPPPVESSRVSRADPDLRSPHLPDFWPLAGAFGSAGPITVRSGNVTAEQRRNIETGRAMADVIMAEIGRALYARHVRRNSPPELRAEWTQIRGECPPWRRVREGQVVAILSAAFFLALLWGNYWPR